MVGTRRGIGNQTKETSSNKPGTKRMTAPTTNSGMKEKDKKKPKGGARDKKEEKSADRQTSREDLSKEKRTEETKKTAKKGPRKRPSFQHDKKIKTTKDIREELIGQRTSSRDEKLVGLNEKKYDVKETLSKGKKGSNIRVVETNNAQLRLVAKTELHEKKRESINNEIRFLLEFQQTLRDHNLGSDHFLTICSYGATREMTWFVQPLCGPNMDDLRRDSELSGPTALRIGLMVLDAISCLHRCEIIHGRLEPQHVLIGAEMMKSCVYVVGLGHICQVTNNTTFTWSRTAAYAPCRGSRDPYATELETWFYLLMDLYGRNFLPWNKKQCSFEETLKWKEQFFLCPQLLPQHFPTLFHDLMNILSNRDEYENNLARVLKRRLLDYLKQEHISRHKPFEWEQSDGLEKTNHAERMREYKKTVSTIKTATQEALKEYQGQDDDD